MLLGFLQALYLYDFLGFLAAKGFYFSAAFLDPALSLLGVVFLPDLCEFLLLLLFVSDLYLFVELHQLTLFGYGFLPIRIVAFFHRKGADFLFQRGVLLL